jgi:cobalt-zinc-cadmium resistance protein CzcA
LEKTAVPNAKIISQTADKQFVNGDINYLDWVVLTNQSVAILDQYINAKRAFSESTLQLNYLTSKN